MKILCAVLLLSTIALSQQTANEKAAWQQEEAYWRLLKAGDKAAYMDLWNDRFTGWPRTQQNPVPKSGVAESFTERLPLSDYKLIPLSVREYGDNLVIVFYRATMTRNGETRTNRMTHTWMREGNTWRIIGGMSADDASSPR